MITYPEAMIIMDNKKLAAATAAVFTYIKTGEEAACYAAAAAPEAIPGTVPALPASLPYNAWGAAGRSDLMQGRFMIQQRVFK